MLFKRIDLLPEFIALAAAHMDGCSKGKLQFSLMLWIGSGIYFSIGFYSLYRLHLVLSLAFVPEQAWFYLFIVLVYFL